MRWLLTVLFVISFSTALAARDEISGQALVIDGGTLEIRNQQIALAGLEAPDAAQTMPWPDGTLDLIGRGSALVLRALTHGDTVRCKIVATRSDEGLKAGICILGDLELNAEMVARGQAWAKAEDGGLDYTAQELAARAAKLGVWRGPAERASVFRARLWQSALSSAPGGCPIKTIIDRNKDRFYILPWSPWYERIALDQNAAGRWFCKESVAREAGWRRPSFLMSSIVMGAYNPSQSQPAVDEK